MILVTCESCEARVNPDEDDPCAFVCNACLDRIEASEATRNEEG